jgi:hypothetical protein
MSTVPLSNSKTVVVLIQCLQIVYISGLSILVLSIFFFDRRVFYIYFIKKLRRHLVRQLPQTAPEIWTMRGRSNTYERVQNPLMLDTVSGSIFLNWLSVLEVSYNSGRFNEREQNPTTCVVIAAG